MNLRREVPDGTQWDAAWGDAYPILQALAPSAPCCMSMEVRQRLFKIVRAMPARTVLDIGTYIGYSALNFALAVGPKGAVVTVDIDPNHAQRLNRPEPQDIARRAGVHDRMQFVIQDARAYLQTHRGFDLICIDGWHEAPAVYEEIRLSLGALNPNGLIFLDDVQPLDYEPPPGNDRFYGPARAVAQLLDERPDIRFARLNTLGTACGFLVQR